MDHMTTAAPPAGELSAELWRAFFNGWRPDRRRFVLMTRTDGIMFNTVVGFFPKRIWQHQN